MAKSLDIFTFHDYRAYLSAWLEDARARRTSNLTRLAEQIGVHTSFLAHVLGGQKNLSFEQAAEVSEALQHTALEREPSEREAARREPARPAVGWSETAK